MEVGEGNGPPTPVLLPGKSHGRRRLVGCHPWGREESDTTERLHFHFSLSCIGEGNGNPLQCSCLENPRDSRAWWAAVYGVSQSRTGLKRLSSSSIVACIYCWSIDNQKTVGEIPSWVRESIQKEANPSPMKWTHHVCKKKATNPVANRIPLSETHGNFPFQSWEMDWTWAPPGGPHNYLHQFVPGLCRWASGKEPTCQWMRPNRHRFNPWVRKIPWRRLWQPTLFSFNINLFILIGG